jgi:hypothetical protein
VGEGGGRYGRPQAKDGDPEIVILSSLAFARRVEGRKTGPALTTAIACFDTRALRARYSA